MIEELISVIKLFFVLYVYYKFGVFYGIIICFLSLYLYRILMLKLFGLEMLNNLDKGFVGKSSRERMLIVVMMCFDKLNPQEFSKMIMERALTKIKKLRQRVVYKYCNFYWEEVDINEVSKRISIINDAKIQTEDDVLKILQLELNIQIDTFKELPYEIKIYPHNNGGYVLWKLDHVLTDGLGILSLICACADNYDIKVFPSIMRNYKNIWYYSIFDWLTFLYYGPIVAYDMFSKDLYKSCFKDGGQPVGISSCAISKKYKLEDLNKVKSNLNLSIHEILMCIISKAIKKINSSYASFRSLEYFQFLMPVGRKEVPTSIEKLELNNHVNSLFLKIPLIEDIQKECGKVSLKIRKSMHNTGYLHAAFIFTIIAIEFLPRRFLEHLANIFTSKVDMVVSNVPGPTQTLYYNGSKLIDMIPMISTARVKTFLPIYSYDGGFRFLISVDKTCVVNNSKFIGEMEKDLDLLISLYQ